jgi:hypothetical protein
MDDLYADNPNNPISSRRQIIGDLAAPISSGSAAEASQACRGFQLKDHATLHTYSQIGIVMCVRNTLLSAWSGDRSVPGRFHG